ncbi:BMP family ABC transporter substrate-binding protein [Roseibium denhamense]|uniref:Basic membrane protein A n=1 Tax=Roseibium denhamense TaxID=76305 RepID=A0ABY1NVG1_9HYPH|nr:BMP family ABC transporter substrate-binding protein [Roseibium denhamense]MTI08164.1 BMP family ABC transporter substrate-binding protein [Roseibium denhamense]SMP16965.1 basic membrane protein A [Roseibium denhamense]
MRGLVQKLLQLALVLATCVSGAAAIAETRGAIIFSSARQDGSFNQLAHVGTQRAVDQFNLAVEEWILADEDDLSEVLRAFAKVDVNHILLIGYDHSAAVREVAPVYPDVKFTVIDGVVSDLPNVRSIVFSEQEGGFIAGYVAGLKSATRHVATIGGMDIPPVRRFMCGFVAGAKHADPGIEVDTAFVGLYITAFRDISGAQALAEQHYMEGADVIFAPAGFAAEGVAKAAGKTDGFVIMVDANQNGLVPGSVLTSALKRVDEAAFSAWKSAVDGSWTPGMSTMSVRENGVDWAVDDHNRALVADFEGEVEKVKEDLATGRVRIEPAPELQECAAVL